MDSIRSFPQTKPKRSLGQNFLVDNEVKNFIVESVLQGFDNLRKNLPQEPISIVEIGPGKGALTTGLLENLGKKADFYLIEKDDFLSEKICKKVEDYENYKVLNCQVLNQDFLEFDLEQIKNKYIVVGSLPYNVSNKIIARLLRADRVPELCIFILQKEVAESYAARPPKMTYLSAFSSIYVSAKILKVIPPDTFRPKPKVESAIIQFDKEESALTGEQKADLERLIRLGFTYPRKTLYNNLKGIYEPVFLSNTIKCLLKDEKARAHVLRLNDWLELSKALKSEVV